MNNTAKVNSRVKGLMQYQLFWAAAGLWNILIGTVLWDLLFKNDKKTRTNLKLRSFVVAFGFGYVLVGTFDWMWWLIVVGIVAKLGVVLDYFGQRFDFKKLKPDLLTYVVIGDLLWVFAFGAVLGMRMSRMRVKAL
jgi:hypothetical protein